MNLDEGRLHRTLADWAASARPFVVATVIRARGSAPRLPGAKMLVPLTGEPLGTVGGGAAEREVLRVAREMLGASCAGALESESRTRILAVDLSQETACGGSMEVFLEAHAGEKELALIGAGHVGRAVARWMAALGWRITVYDPRAERLQDPDFAGCARVQAEFLEAPEKIRFSDRLFILVMTPDHTFDREIAAACLERPWRWLGVMGSARKAREIRRYLSERGFPPERIARLRVPVGLEIGSDTPDEIAVSIAAELIRETSTKRRPVEGGSSGGDKAARDHPASEGGA